MKHRLVYSCQANRARSDVSQSDINKEQTASAHEMPLILFHWMDNFVVYVDKGVTKCSQKSDECRQKSDECRQKSDGWRQKSDIVKREIKPS